LGLVGFFVGDVWSGLAETVRVGNSHISYRLNRVPWRQHPEIMFSACVVLSWFVGAVRYHSERSREPRIEERVGIRSWVFVLAMIGTVTACGRSPLLAGGPIDLSEHPTTLRFIQPVPLQGEVWELCFEFDQPGESHRASTIHATLVSSTGGRAAIRAPTLDRRGESTVCQIGHVTAEPGTESTVYEAVELYSDVPLRLLAIRGGSPL
jgi:hypothetical protein